MPAAAAAPKNVLILSEGPVLPYGVVLRETLVAALRHDGTEPVNVYEELIDRTRLDSDEYDRELVTFYKVKYGKATPVLIIAITEPALDFALRHRQELFPSAALLFGAVDERVLRARDLGANVTGVFSRSRRAERRSRRRSRFIPARGTSSLSGESPGSTGVIWK